MFETTTQHELHGHLAPIAMGRFPGLVLDGNTIQPYNIGSEKKPRLVEMREQYTVMGWTYHDFEKVGHVPTYVRFKNPGTTKARQVIHEVGGTPITIKFSPRYEVAVPPIHINSPEDIDHWWPRLTDDSIGLVDKGTTIHVDKLITRTKVDGVTEPDTFTWKLCKIPGIDDGKERIKVLLSHYNNRRVCDLPKKTREQLNAIVGSIAYDEVCHIEPTATIETIKLHCGGRY